jgi:hypothetical protein
MQRVTLTVAVLSMTLVACGGSDDGSSCVEFIEPMQGVHTDMVLLSSLDIEVPTDLGFDPPVPSDVQPAEGTSSSEPDTVSVRLTTAATLEQLDGYYISAFDRCSEAARSLVPSTGDVTWLGSAGGDMAYYVHFLDGELLIEYAPR